MKPVEIVLKRAGGEKRWANPTKIYFIYLFIYFSF
jgi:hypothetical protein